MRLSTALRITSLIVIAKAVLIGVVYWRRAELLGRCASWAGMSAIIAIGIVIAVAICVAARNFSHRFNASSRSPRTG
jgi:hypothetical protein